MSETRSPDLLAADGDLLLRRMRDDADDYALLARWRSDDRVLATYGGRDRPLSFAQAQAKYRPRIAGEEPVQPCILEQHGQALGYLQFYPLDQALPPQVAARYGPELVAGGYAFDIFIGEPAFWDQGLGTRAVKLLAQYLFDSHDAAHITVDPAAGNGRAIRCYEKAGFHKVRWLPAYELHEGRWQDHWLMLRRKTTAEGLSPIDARP